MPTTSENQADEDSSYYHLLENLKERPDILVIGTVGAHDLLLFEDTEPRTRRYERFFDLSPHVVSDSENKQYIRLARKWGGAAHYIIQAHLRGVPLPDVNFAHADLTTSVFSDTFGSVLSVAVSPNGELLAAGTADGKVRLWYVADGRPFRTLQGHRDWVRSVVFSPDNRMVASASEDGTVRLWEVSSGQPVKRLQGHEGQVRSVAFSPDGTLLVRGVFTKGR